MMQWVTLNYGALRRPNYPMTIKADSQYDATVFMQLLRPPCACHMYVLTGALVNQP